MVMPTASDVLRDYVSDVRNYTRDGVYIKNALHSAKDIPPDELAILAQELDTLCDWEQNPTLAAMIARGAPRILDAVRMVNYETKDGYGGAGARGHKLVVNVMVVGDLLKFNASTAALSTDAKVTWLETKTAVAAACWSGTSTYNNEMLVSSLPVLAHVFLGFIDPVEIPKIDYLQLIKDGDPWTKEALTWNWRQTFGANRTPTYELRQPWVIPPGKKYYIAANYYLSGDDKLQPIGFTIKRATDIISALA